MQKNCFLSAAARRMGMIELDVKIESGDLYDYMLRHSYNSPAGIIGSCAGAFLVILAVVTRRWIYLVFGIIVLVYLPWTLFLRSKQQVMSNASFQQPLHYMLDDQGLTVSQGEESMQILWEEMHKAVSTGRSIILYTSPINATIFPKSQMEDRKNSIIEMISTHMPPAKVKIRS